MSDKFFRRLCSRANLFSAWRHVRGRAASSKSEEIREAANDFDFHAFTNIQSIQSLLVQEKFSFPPAEGVLKDKKKRALQQKLPRPIVISDIRSRIVQRALLQCLQPSADDELAASIGELHGVNNSSINFGGTPSGGVQRAIHRVNSLLGSGHQLYYKSDIGSFFTHVPHAQVVEFIRSQIRDERFVRVFENGLKVELKNADRLGEYQSLFPENGIGVPQGSSLSAFAGNIFLHRLDAAFRIEDAYLVRYIDDILILARDNSSLMKAKEWYSKQIKALGLFLYLPEKNPDKASIGHSRNGIDYLGCIVRHNHVEPSKKTKASIIERVRLQIAQSKKSIQAIVTAHNPKRDNEKAFAQSIVEIDSMVRGWANSFRFVNNRLPFTQVDESIARMIADFRRWLNDLALKDPANINRALGVYQTQDVQFKSLDEYVEKRARRVPVALTTQRKKAPPARRISEE